MKGTLGPMLKENEVTRNLKVMVYDESRTLLPQWADTVFNDPETSKYVDGIGVHWYLDTVIPASVLTTVHERHPEKFILATEACTGAFVQRGPLMGDWGRAEEYAVDIITDLNNFVAGWTDWNLCLDKEGGPNWVYNFVDSPVIVNGKVDEFYKQPMFYALGHFSYLTRPPGRLKGTSNVEAMLNVASQLRERLFTVFSSATPPLRKFWLGSMREVHKKGDWDVQSQARTSLRKKG
ncbi:O-Glycosyl hydrolase family 30 [Necator americanus]|uniref:Glucosylceramidase n=1 Tax=Necator americanus TaxID=51031 RepID=W2T7B3_NECAM|nr:O-Glycosyl hydrolase family 30 [Necator americanus]ETN77524.1 O-Glycosyl hydrolase family 30 [Necator americanus]